MIRRYGILGLLKLAVSLIYTKLFFRNAKLIRLPFDIRNKGFIEFGKGLTTGFGCRVEAYPETKNKVLFIGDNVQMNDYVHITAMKNVTIGNNVLMASKIYISDCSHGSYSGDNNDSHPDLTPVERSLFSKPVSIEDNVWLGEFVSVLPGVTIGKGTIVGANSVVSKSLPNYVIAVGSPAKPIKKFNFEINKWEKI
ncbi:acetyltransferase [Flavobacterium sp. Root935]|uniref:DapH/DapD/GlmU-related protein n=1 Tax=Flavobacterium sp. Root935 TaxID=1736610 RepID=UPI00070F8415|nr:DapH/DapD/GlmU-related protein [Flavobacterium sp. Root935]KRD63892.1 acetyltransferase [Flavobacterium sp. Root935]